MTQFENQLWDKILGFDFDEPGTVLTFTARLARENGWNHSYTKRVINEYKKFIFLCCTATTQVTPPDPVDQAWHLHLTYTKSYWNNLCRDTLGMEIHHNPTKGGEAEQLKFDGLYTGAQDDYLEKFGTTPPPDIWHDNQTRFSDINFRRVNLAQYWLVKKPKVTIRYAIETLVLAGIGLISIQAAGIDFIIILIALIIVITVLRTFNNRGNGNNNGSDGGCSTFSCSSDSGHNGCSSHGGDSGCSSSGCSSSGCSSGCSGCGGGCGGGD